MIQTDSTNAIEVGGLRNQFSAQCVHQDLDRELRRGEFLGVVGGSGTGKSVLLRSIVGLQLPAAGTVRIEGQDLLCFKGAARARLERRFGILFQKDALYFSLSVLENVALPLIEHADLPRSLAEHLARSKLGLAGLPGEAAGKYPASLSGGMVKRAALARALALDAGLLFLEEATTEAGPDRCCGIRPIDTDLAQCLRADGLPDRPRPRYALHDLRPRRSAGQQARAGERSHRSGRAFRPSLDPGLFPWPARPCEGRGEKQCGVGLRHRCRCHSGSGRRMGDGRRSTCGAATCRDSKQNFFG